MPKRVKNSTKIILLTGGVVLVVMLLFPPYFGIDVESDGQVHSSIGHHPIWSPPTSEEVYSALVPVEKRSDPVTTGELVSFEARINMVKLVMQFILLGVLMLVAPLIVRRVLRAPN